MSQEEAGAGMTNEQWVEALALAQEIRAMLAHQHARSQVQDGSPPNQQTGAIGTEYSSSHAVRRDLHVLKWMVVTVITILLAGSAQSSCCW